MLFVLSHTRLHCVTVSCDINSERVYKILMKNMNILLVNSRTHCARVPRKKEITERCNIQCYWPQIYSACSNCKANRIKLLLFLLHGSGVNLWLPCLLQIPYHICLRRSVHGGAGAVQYGSCRLYHHVHSQYDGQCHLCNGKQWVGNCYTGAARGAWFHHHHQGDPSDTPAPCELLWSLFWSIIHPMGKMPICLLQGGNPQPDWACVFSGRFTRTSYHCPSRPAGHHFRRNVIRPRHHLVRSLLPSGLWYRNNTNTAYDVRPPRPWSPYYWFST